MLGFLSPSPIQMLMVGLIAVLLFGNRLPSVARSLGKSFIEFKKGLRGIEDEVNGAIHNDRAALKRDEQEDRQLTSAPRFEPPKAAPESADTTA